MIFKSNDQITSMFVVAAAILLVFVCMPAPQASGQEELTQGSPRSSLDDHRVFLIGDSQTSGAFGEGLAWQLVSRGVTYFSRAGQPGWGVPNWARERNQIRRLLDRHHPTLLLVELGGNDWERSGRPSYEDKVQRFWDFLNNEMNTIHDDHDDENWRVLWISPATVVGPRSTELQPGRDRAAQTIKTVVTERNYVDSSDVTGDFGRSPDGLHFTPEGGRDWARRLLPRIEQKLNASPNK